MGLWELRGLRELSTKIGSSRGLSKSYVCAMLFFN